VPPPISKPFLKTCEHLELPPVATYAAVVLWNWRPIFDWEPVDALANLATLMTFTGSLDESWFYLVSTAIEAVAGPIIPMMIEAIAAARRNDIAKVTQCLRTFAERLDEIGMLFERMYESCDPHVFYHRIRPFLAGGKNMAGAGLPHGVKFDDGTGEQPYVQYSGGSNAQSSIIQFFDIILGVEHRPTGEKRGAGSCSGAHSGAPNSNFIVDMRKYMPGPHRRFLEHVETVANIREFVQTNKSSRALVVAYDATLAMLRTLRDKHIQLVSRYIIIKSRESSTPAPMSPKQTPVQRLNLAIASKRTDSKQLRGTGGTPLISFLKQARDETGEPAIDAWAHRLMNNGPAESNNDGVARLRRMSEHLNGKMEPIGLAGKWSVDGNEGGVSVSHTVILKRS
jgi:indoleamine 2,3-dioxygenase